MRMGRGVRGACGVVLLGVALTGCGHKADKAESKQPPVVTGVTLVPAAGQAIPDGVEAVGTVRAADAAVIAARLPATVTGVLVREGDRVGKGKLLVTLEAAESSAQASAAAAQVAEAERALDEARARKRLADATYERYANLFKDEAVTRQEMDNRRADRDVAEQGVGRATARLAASRESARAAGVVAGYTRIVSPLAGVVTAKQVENGMTVFPGTPLMTIEGDGGHRLEASVPESLAGRVKRGQRVPVTIDGAGLSLEGRVVEVVPAADPASRTFTVKVELAGAGIRSGMFGRAFIATGERQGILVPKSAVMERGALSSVWTVDQGNVARLRLVKTGKPLGDRIEILSGLTAGERVIAAGLEKVVEGAKIQ
ncbi:efflux RND transporter periplasmic adaptor subunit [Geobacter anodireducens]|uniref:RND transporter n=1 Tax=Geobacter soli TaxID=1510391 RepID=A0A0C1QSU4_9BACT|nr:efflux RND transporter periplasmic adaptor subunit [Geobacter soli]KIE44062.1 RND transporter [Geobacter soli]